MPKNIRNSDDWAPVSKKQKKVVSDADIKKLLDEVLKSLETFYDPKGTVI